MKKRIPPRDDWPAQLESYRPEDWAGEEWPREAWARARFKFAVENLPHVDPVQLLSEEIQIRRAERAAS